MARLYGEIQGNRGEATRMGTAESGIRAHIRGWNVGVKVDGYVDADGRDTFDVYATGGSNNSGVRQSVATITISETGDVIVWKDDD